MMKSDEAAVGIVTLLSAVVRLYDQRIGLFSIVARVAQVWMEQSGDEREQLIKGYAQSGLGVDPADASGAQLGAT